MLIERERESRPGSLQEYEAKVRLREGRGVADNAA